MLTISNRSAKSLKRESIQNNLSKTVIDKPLSKHDLPLKPIEHLNVSSSHPQANTNIYDVESKENRLSDQQTGTINDTSEIDKEINGLHI